MAQLGNETTSVHFHGLFQNGSTDMDGPVGVRKPSMLLLWTALTVPKSGDAMRHTTRRHHDLQLHG